MPQDSRAKTSISCMAKRLIKHVQFVLTVRIHSHRLHGLRGWPERAMHPSAEFKNLEKFTCLKKRHESIAMVWRVACDCATNAKKQGRRRDATDLVVSAGAPGGPACPLWTLPATDEGLDDATELPRESIPPAPMPAPFPMAPAPRWPHCCLYNRTDLIKHNHGSATTSPCCPARGCDENVVLCSRR